MVIPSSYEPFGLVVNESMLCGCPVIASDRVGAVRDLIAHGETGFVYPCGDTTALAKTIRDALQDSNALTSIQTNALAKIRAWSPQASADALVAAVEAAIARRHPKLRSRRCLLGKVHVKLLIYSHYFAPSVGGVETIVALLARKLCESQIAQPRRR